MLLVFMIVDVVHQSHEFRDDRVEFDLREFLLLDVQNLHAERQHALHVRVVVRGVIGGPGHVIFDKVVRAGQEVPGRRFCQVADGHSLLLLSFALPLRARGPIAGVVRLR